MTSNTRNVKLGACQITYKGTNLGYTKGGVDVDVTTETHPVTVDQFGESVINEYITKRNIKVTCPLAESTIENLALIMPGSSIVSDGVKASLQMDFAQLSNFIPGTEGTKSSFSMTTSSNFSIGDTITFGGITFTFGAAATSTSASSSAANVKVDPVSIYNSFKNLVSAFDEIVKTNSSLPSTGLNLVDLDHSLKTTSSGKHFLTFTKKTVGSAAISAATSTKATITSITGVDASSGDVVKIGSTSLEFFDLVTSDASKVKVGANLPESLANLAYAISSMSGILGVTAFVDGGDTLSLSSTTAGTGGNSHTAQFSPISSKTNAPFAITQASFTGGANSSSASSINITNAVGVNLLDNAGPLLLRPVANIAANGLSTSSSEDLYIPMAATAGAMKFSYKHNDERIFNTEFNGYPSNELDPDTGLHILFKVGDSTSS